MTTAPTHTPPKPTNTIESPAEVQEKIRRRARELYENRGRHDGQDLEDWLQKDWQQAEAELTEVAGLKSKGSSV